MALVCVIAAALPSTAAAQAGAAVLGRVYDADTDAAVQNALVTLEGFGSTLTDPDGRFRFRGVTLGTYTLRVEGFSYAPASEQIEVDGDVTIDVPLGSAPLPLDSIVVEAGTVDYHGRVRDAGRDFSLVDAQVLVRGREPIWTDSHGRFDLANLPADVPVSFAVRAFGYLPVDTVLIPDDGQRYDFDLQRDAFSEAMIAMQVRRLEQRAGGRVMTGQGVLDRAEVLRYATGAHTAGTMLAFEYPERTLRRIVCTFLDERQIDVVPGMGSEIAEAILGHTLPEEIERVELLQFDTPRTPDGKPLILQAYTRSFIMAMSTQELALRERTLTAFGQCF